METSRALTSFMWYVLICAQCYGANTLQAFGGRSANLNLDKLIVSGYFPADGFDSWMPTSNWGVWKSSDQLLPEYVVEF